MENQEEEIKNIDQFQISRSDAEEPAESESEENQYTEDEVQFADGEGTQLDAEVDGNEEDEALLGDDLDEAEDNESTEDEGEASDSDEEQPKS